MFSDILHCATLSELIEVAKVDKYDKQASAFVRHETMCFPYMQHVGVVAFEKWYLLSKHIQRRCVFMCTATELKDIVSLSSKSMFSAWLSKLTKAGMLVVEYPEGVKSERRRVCFNPHLVWKGSYRVRRNYRREWDKQ